MVNFNGLWFGWKQIDIHVKDLLRKPKDPNEPRFGTYNEKGLQVHREMRAPEIERRVKKKVDIVKESPRFHGEQVEKIDVPI